MMFGFAESERPTLTTGNREIIFDVITIHQRHRQTTCDSNRRNRLSAMSPKNDFLSKMQISNDSCGRAFQTRAVASDQESSVTDEARCTAIVDEELERRIRRRPYSRATRMM